MVTHVIFRELECSRSFSRPPFIFFYPSVNPAPRLACPARSSRYPSPASRDGAHLLFECAGAHGAGDEQDRTPPDAPRKHRPESERILVSPGLRKRNLVCHHAANPLLADSPRAPAMVDSTHRHATSSMPRGDAFCHTAPKISIESTAFLGSTYVNFRMDLPCLAAP